MGTIIIVSYKPKLTWATKQLEQYQANLSKNKGEAKRFTHQNIFIIISLAAMCLLGCLIIAIALSYLPITAWPNMFLY